LQLQLQLQLQLFLTLPFRSPLRGNRNRFGRVQYPKGIAPRSQTGMVLVDRLP
jgi:hypothetical protein